MKSILEINVQFMRDLVLLCIVFAFLAAAIFAALLAADRHYENECRVQQEYRQCR